MASLELYLIRHGIAEERGPAYPDDRKRPLTEKGIEAMRDAVRGLDGLGVSFDLILTSPLVRTRQTADVVADGLGKKTRIVSCDALAPEGTAAGVVKEIARHDKAGRIALVGHEPNMGELAAHLLGARAAIPFKKGAVCRIDFDDRAAKGAGELRWFLPPRALRKLG